MAEKPTIGILLGERTLQNLLDGWGSPRLDALVRANSVVKANIFFFKLSDIDFGRRTIRGHYHDAQGNWRIKNHGYPDAFYRRFTVPGYQKAIFNKFLKQLRTRGTLFLNYQFAFDKWELHNVLTKNSSVNQNLPETRLVKTISQVVEMLDQFPILYLKACTGGRGREVMRVEKIGKASYAYSYFRYKLIRGKTFSLSELVSSFFGQQVFIAQQAIDLIQADGRNIDFRAEVQLSADGTPQIGAIPVRIARMGSPITTHSTSMSMKQFIQDYSHLLARFNGNFEQQAEVFATKIFQALEQGFGYGAEVGIDFGVDKTGKFWLIECNAQSAKVSLFNSYSQNEVDKTFVDLLQYAVAHGKKERLGAK